MTTLKHADSPRMSALAFLRANPRLIDTHVHLCDEKFDADRGKVLLRAKGEGIATLIEIADAPAEWEKVKGLTNQCSKSSAQNVIAVNSSEEAISLSTLRLPRSLESLAMTETTLQEENFPRIYWACGFHPHYAEESSQFDFGIMKKVASDPNCVAIGEIGLDYLKSQALREKQIALFQKGLELAAELSKPVVIHCREAQADTLRILRSFFGGLSKRELVSGVIHCFSGDQHFAEGCLDLGFFLGVDGPITYPSAKELREVIKKIPLEKIVLETDAPYLPPQNFRGKRNEPAYLLFVAEKISELFGEDPKTIAEQTSANAKRLFRIA